MAPQPESFQSKALIEEAANLGIPVDDLLTDDGTEVAWVALNDFKATIDAVLVECRKDVPIRDWHLINELRGGGCPVASLSPKLWERIQTARSSSAGNSQFSTAPPSYSRQTILCAADMLKALGHSGFSRFLLELELPDPQAGQGSGLMARATSLAEFAIKNPETLSPERRTVAYEIILRAIELWNEGVTTNLSSREREKFSAAMEREGLSSKLGNTDDGGVTVGGEDEGNGWTGASITLSGSSLNKMREAMSANAATARAETPNRVFVVHGHDDGAREGVARFLEKMGLEAIILMEQPNMGRTIIEKFIDYAEVVGFAVVLLTPDDIGGAAATETQSARARQNVVFELGYFVGSLGRGKACLLRKGNVEIPSDLYGVVYTTMDPAGAWKIELARELKAAGFNVDIGKALA